MMKQLLMMLLALMLCLLPGFALAANNGNTYPRLEELTTETSTVSTYSLRNTGAETVAQAIAAGKIPKADKSRLKATLPTGMAGTITYEDGLITVTVDLKASDWETVLATLASFPHVNFRHTLDRPNANYEHHVGFGGNGVPDEPYERVLYLMQQDIPAWGEGNGTQAGNGERTCEIIPTQALAQAARDDESTHVIAWIDWYTDEKGNQQQNVYYEYYKVRITVKDVDAFHIPFHYVTESALKASKNVSLPNGVEIKSITDGDITFRTKSTFTQSANVTVAINAPSDAAYMKINSPEHYSRNTYTVSGGKASFAYQVHPNSNSEEQFTVAWYDSNDKMLDYGLFMFHCEPSTYAPWPAYDSNWHAVPSSRVSLINNAAGAGVTFKYTDYTSSGDDYGVLHTDYDPDAEITGNVDACVAKVKVPDGIYYYRTNSSGANNIMGEDSYFVSSQVNFTSTQELHAVTPGQWIEVVYTEPVRTIYAGPLEIYMQNGEGDVWPYSGGVISLFWYTSLEQANTKNGKSPEKIEYIATTQGALCVTNRVPVVEKEEDIKEPVKEVTCVGSEAYAKGWRLVIRRYPHKGSKAFHYELTLENEYGAYQPLTEQMIFYMPYPSDYFSHPEYTYGLRHYDDDYNGYELVEVSETEFGVRFVISSLSPFVLQWEDPNNPTPDNPGGDGGDHGDNSGSDNGRYHLYHLDFQPGFDVELRKVRVMSITTCSQGTAVIVKSKIDGMNVLVADYKQSGKGIVLTDKTTIDQLTIEVHPRMTVDQLPTEPFIFLDNATINEIRLMDKSYLDYILKWIECCNTDVKTIQIEGQNAPIDFAAFYDAYFGN